MRGVKQILEVEGILVVRLQVSAIYLQFSQWFAHSHSSFLWGWLAGAKG
jgi:hypothetical protein